VRTFFAIVVISSTAVLGCSSGSESTADRGVSASSSDSAAASADADTPRAFWRSAADEPRPGEPSPESQPAAKPTETEPPAQASGPEIRLGPSLTLTAPEGWVRQTPRIGMIAYEYFAPAAEGDDADGRMTVMEAGGSVEANLDRWIGQFTQPDGSETRDKARIDKKTLAGREVHLVDVSGTYHDAMGPFAPATERPDYRMLAAIISTPRANYFVKFYGPRKTIAQHEPAFRAMIEGLQ